MSTRRCVSHRLLVGLEIHVQLATRSKMFTSVANLAGALKVGEAPPEPNIAVDPVILGLPGVLPVINEQAVRYSVMAGLAMECQIATYTKWDRKSYYYPDLPKNYQISQYDLPLCGPGTFEIEGEDGKPLSVRIRRAHLEEDAGKLLHEAPGGYRIEHSIVDLNRAGTPLLEIVTEPDLHTPKDVALFGQELQKLVQFLGISEGQMQLGHMRFEPNINVHITDEQGVVHKTAITEIKNLNSFSVLEKATAYEVHRQIKQWEETGELGRKSTYGWDDQKQQTFFQRTKEEADDYRYFPDPDLVPVELPATTIQELKAQIGELPRARRKRYLEALKLQPSAAEFLIQSRAIGDYFEDAIAIEPSPKRIADLMMNALTQIAKRYQCAITELQISAERLGQIAGMIDKGLIAASKAPDVLLLIEERHGHLEEDDLRAAGLLQSTDTGPVDAAIEAVLATNPPGLADYKAGKQSALGSLIGAVMKQGKGLNAKVVGERLRARLGETAAK
jgi:aspartyl-tRNA(Asn)/glutamyl-tRNA(Gln) amidotransferase subunit B